jgi:hypothetical protein
VSRIAAICQTQFVRCANPPSAHTEHLQNARQGAAQHLFLPGTPRDLQAGHGVQKVAANRLRHQTVVERLPAARSLRPTRAEPRFTHQPCQVCHEE